MIVKYFSGLDLQGGVPACHVRVQGAEIVDQGHIRAGDKPNGCQSGKFSLIFVFIQVVAFLWFNVIIFFTGGLH